MKAEINGRREIVKKVDHSAYLKEHDEVLNGMDAAIRRGLRTVTQPGLAKREGKVAKVAVVKVKAVVPAWGDEESSDSE